MNIQRTLHTLLPELRSQLALQGSPHDPRTPATTVILEVLEVASKLVTTSGPLHELSLRQTLSAARAGLNFLNGNDASQSSEASAELHDTPKRLLQQLIQLSAVDEEQLVEQLSPAQLEVFFNTMAQARHVSRLNTSTPHVKGVRGA